MPFYREQFQNRALVHQHASSPSNKIRVVLDDAVVTSFRTRPHPHALSTSIVSDLTADPYAYFLDQQTQRKYREALKQRGLEPKGDPDKGHPFELSRYTLRGRLHDVINGSTHYPSVLVLPSISSGNQLDGVHNGRLNGSFPSYSPGSTTLDVFAQQAYARTAPDPVTFDLFQFVGETFANTPKVLLDSLNFQKKWSERVSSGGSDALNVEFGWKPLVRDLQALGAALFHTTKMLQRGGNRVHRRFALPPESFSDARSGNSSVLWQFGNPGQFSVPGQTLAGGGGTGQSSSWDYVKTRTVKRWFEGEFTYFHPLDFDPSDYFSRLDQFVSVKMSASALWELAPWSWMVDWFLRIGDTIRAAELSANDRLILHYGYAMEHTVYTTELSWRATSAPSAGFSGAPSRGWYLSTSERKRRIRANPYGFRVGGWSGLTAGQQSILGALALSKAK